MRRPLFIAEQARHPRGLIGKLVAAIMQHETAATNRRVIKALQVQSIDHVIDIGCGNGLSLGMLAQASPAGHCTGIDPSEVMVRRATANNRALIDEQRAIVKLATVEQLPFSDGCFDKAMSVHTLYFWNNLPAAFGEIARILKPNGKCVILFRTTADPKTSDFSNAVYRFSSRAEIATILEAAGFLIQSGHHDTDEPAMLIAIKRPNNF